MMRRSNHPESWGGGGPEAARSFADASTQPRRDPRPAGRCFSARDVDAVAELYEEDATLIVPPDGRQVRGKAEIRDAAAGTFALHATADFRVVGKLQRDGLALTHGRWRLDGRDPAARGSSPGRGTLVSRRQPDGRWLIAVDDA